MNKKDIMQIISVLKKKAIKTPRFIGNPTNALLNLYEKKVDFKFPHDYKIFLMKASTLFVGNLEPLQVTSDRSSRSELANALFDARRLGLPDYLLPICEDNGDYYFINNKGEVFYWSHGLLNGERWPDIATWIEDVWIGNN